MQDQSAITATVNNRPVKPVKGIPLLGNALDAIKDPLNFLVSLKKDQDDIVSVRIGTSKYYIIQTPEASAHILQENAANYIKPGAAKLMKQFLGEGLATSNGSLWLKQRRLIQPAFHKKKLEGILHAINDETNTLIQAWKKNPSGQSVEISDGLLKLTLGNISRTMFGAGLNGKGEEIATVINRLLACASSPVSALLRLPLFVPVPVNIRFRKANAEFEKIIYEIIEQRKNESATPAADLLDLLLHAYDDESSTGMTGKQLRDEIATIFMAGHETTAQTLCWTLYHLALYPAIYERVRNESASLEGEITTIDALQKLSYTKAVIEETMRLYPPVWLMARRSVTDDNICGFNIPAGTTTLINIYGMNHHAGYWNDPGSFRPERFTATDTTRHPFLFIPFGMGRRLCIGNMFAMTVMQTVVSRLVRAFSFEIADGYKPVARPGITLRTKNGIYLQLKHLISSPEYTDHANNR